MTSWPPPWEWASRRSRPWDRLSRWLPSSCRPFEVCIGDFYTRKRRTPFLKISVDVSKSEEIVIEYHRLKGRRERIRSDFMRGENERVGFIISSLIDESVLWSRRIFGRSSDVRSTLSQVLSVWFLVEIVFWSSGSVAFRHRDSGQADPYRQKLRWQREADNRHDMVREPLRAREHRTLMQRNHLSSHKGGS